MVRILTSLLLSATLLLTACGGGADKGNPQLAAKKKELEKLQQEQADINTKITKLQKEIAKIDPAAAQEEKAKLVALSPVQSGAFNHFIDLQGSVISDKISYVAPRNGTGGYVKRVLVEQGQSVRKGQLLLVMDGAVIEKQIAQAQVQLTQARDILRRRENLWKENIGTEVELVKARNDVSAAEKGIAILREQQSFNNVYADVSGVAEEVTVRQGELFTGNPAAGHIKIVNTTDLKMRANVPENYLGQVKPGSPVVVTFPDINRKFNGRVSLSGQLIDPATRSFYVEVELPADAQLRPNQVANVQIQDYSKNNAISVPVNTLQTDEKGKYVMVAVQEGNRLIARKKQVTPGQLYSDRLEVTGGLSGGEQLIVDGYQDVYDGQLLTTK